MQGSRGEASHAGTKNSGFRAWAQNMQSRVVVDLWHNEHFGRDFVDVEVDSSTMNYGAPGRIRLLQSADINALLLACEADPSTKKHLNAARQSLEKADEAARKFQKKADKLKEKARA